MKKQCAHSVATSVAGVLLQIGLQLTLILTVHAQTSKSVTSSASESGLTLPDRRPGELNATIPPFDRDTWEFYDLSKNLTEHHDASSQYLPPLIAGHAITVTRAFGDDDEDCIAGTRAAVRPNGLRHLKRKVMCEE
jgi:hypothetical protein